jgi:nitrogen-specific signal transduction histidine kinase
MARMLGYRGREELLSIDIPTELFASPARYGEFWAALASAGALRSREETLRRKDGSLVYTLQNTVLVRDASGTIIQFRGLMQDMSQSKFLSTRLTQTETMAAIEPLVAGAARAIDDPLTAILGFADLLTQDPQVPASAKPQLQIIVDEAQRIRQIVQDLLARLAALPASVGSAATEGVTGQDRG